MPPSAHHYRITLGSPPPASFTNWFPELTTREAHDGSTVLEGPVVDASQLAGILTAICHRNGNILCVQRMVDGDGRTS